MSTNPRTLRLVTALADKHPDSLELFSRWARFQCPECRAIDYQKNLLMCRCNACRCEWEISGVPKLLACPNLTHRNHLADLFDVCKYLAGGGACMLRHCYSCSTKGMQYEANISGRWAHDQATESLALLAAAEAALGLEKWGNCPQHGWKE